MSYSQAHKGNVTMIDDLPDLGEVENRNPYNQAMPRQMPGPNGQIPEGVLPPDMAQKMQRHVRMKQQLSPESGMAPYHQPMPEHYNPPMEEPQHEMLQSSSSPTCLDIHGHVTNCPICSRFFNNDRTVLYIIIAVLVIICLLLLKKVLDV